MRRSRAWMAYCALLFGTMAFSCGPAPHHSTSAIVCAVSKDMAKDAIAFKADPSGSLDQVASDLGGGAVDIGKADPFQGQAALKAALDAAYNIGLNAQAARSSGDTAALQQDLQGLGVALQQADLLVGGSCSELKTGGP